MKRKVLNGVKQFKIQNETKRAKQMFKRLENNSMKANSDKSI